MRPTIVGQCKKVWNAMTAIIYCLAESPICHTGSYYAIIGLGYWPTCGTKRICLDLEARLRLSHVLLPTSRLTFSPFEKSWRGIQSNAVGWLTQSITDNLKTCQQQVVTAVDIIARCVWMPCANVGVPSPMHRAEEFLLLCW